MTRLSAETEAKLSKLPPQVLQQAQAQKAQGNTQLWDELLKLADSKTPPETKSWLGRKWAIFKNNLPGVAVNAAVSGSMWAGVTAAIHSFGGESLPFVGSRPSADVIKAVNEDFKAKGIKNADGSDRTIDDVLPPTDKWVLAAQRGGIVAGITAVFGSVMALFNPQADTAMQQEDDIKKQLWAMMNNPTPPRAQARASNGELGGLPSPTRVPGMAADPRAKHNEMRPT